MIFVLRLRNILKLKSPRTYLFEILLPLQKMNNADAYPEDIAAGQAAIQLHIGRAQGARNWTPEENKSVIDIAENMDITDALSESSPKWNALAEAVAARIKKTPRNGSNNCSQLKALCAVYRTIAHNYSIKAATNDVFKNRPEATVLKADGTSEAVDIDSQAFKDNFSNYSNALYSFMLRLSPEDLKALKIVLKWWNEDAFHAAALFAWKQDVNTAQH
jgi:hypothetical protein